jgi:hypothetical protein
MTEDKKVRLTLTDEDMVTSPKLTRRSLLAGAGIALGTVALAGRSAMAEEKDNADAEADKGDAEDDKDKADAEADTGEAERDAD